MTASSPAYVLFGAYFPLWLMSAVIGVVAAIVAHRAFVARGLVGQVPFQLSVCTAIGSMAAAIFWLFRTGLI